jgi:hypothetical protein
MFAIAAILQQAFFGWQLEHFNRVNSLVIATWPAVMSLKLTVQKKDNLT